MHLPKWLFLCLLTAGLGLAFVGGMDADPVCLPLAASTSQPSSFHWGDFLAPFHSVLLHFPIAFLTLAFILEMYSGLRPSHEVREVCYLVLGLACFSAPAVALLGFLRASEGGYDTEMLSHHRLAGSVVALLAILLFFGGRHLAKSGGTRRLRFAYRTLLAATLLIMIVAGHLGGSLSHGPRYLIRNAPSFLKEYFSGRTFGSTSTQPGKLNEAELFYTRAIETIFQARCQRCHGPDVHMSDFRLDTRARAFKGGASGLPAIVPGEPMKSNLVRVILLPKEHEGGMPPPGIEQLSAEEILAIVHWIQNGAVFVDPSSAEP